MEAEEEADPRDVLRVDLVPTMEDKVGGSSSRRKGAAKCLDRPVFSTCFQLFPLVCHADRHARQAGEGRVCRAEGQQALRTGGANAKR